MTIQLALAAGYVSMFPFLVHYGAAEKTRPVKAGSHYLHINDEIGSKYSCLY